MRQVIEQNIARLSRKDPICVNKLLVCVRVENVVDSFESAEVISKNRCESYFIPHLSPLNLTDVTHTHENTISYLYI